MDMYQKREMRKNKKMNEDKKSLPSTGINWFPGHMAKTRRLISEKYPLIDIVYEVVDARIPFSSKIKDIYNIIGNKPKIIIMTKKDLCDIKVTENWIKYYESLGNHVLLVDLNNTNDYEKIISLTHELMAPVQAKRIDKGMKEKEIRALVVGIPNVGKSTLINRMCKRKVAGVANNPGVTKNLTWLRTHSDILLLDTPGILWPKLEGESALNLAAFTAIRQEILPHDDVAVYILKKLSSCYPKILKEVYNLDEVTDESIIKSYETIGKSIGAIKGGEVDYDRVSIKIINDIKTEKIKGVTFDQR